MCVCVCVCVSVSVLTLELLRTHLDNSMLLNLNTHEADLNAGLLRLGPSIEAFGDNTCHYIRTNPGKKKCMYPILSDNSTHYK